MKSVTRTDIVTQLSHQTLTYTQTIRSSITILSHLSEKVHSILAKIANTYISFNNKLKWIHQMEPKMKTTETKNAKLTKNETTDNIAMSRMHVELGVFVGVCDQ